MADSSRPLVGRHSERRQLHDLIDGTEATRRCVAVVGLSGVGKSRLLDESEAIAGQSEFVVARGSCLDLGESWPLHPLHEAVKRLERTNPTVADRLHQLIEPSTEGGGNLLGRVHRGLVELVEERPLLIILDDFQWADQTTKRLVATLLSGLTAKKILVVLAARADSSQASPPLAIVSGFERSQMMRVIKLAPFDLEQTKELAVAIAKRPFSDTEVDRLWRRSGGLPVLIVELLTHPDDELSPYVFQLNQRIEGLPDLTRRFLQVVSLAGRAVRHDLIRDVLRLDDDQTLEAAKSAVSNGVVAQHEGGYAPLHDVFREKAAELLLAKERQVLHGRIAETMEQQIAQHGSDDVDEVELAHHWASAGAAERALQPLINAGRRTSDDGAYEEAWRHWSTVVDMLVKPPDWADSANLQHQAAEVAFATQRYDQALSLIDDALASCSRSGSAGVNHIDLQVARVTYLKAAGHLEQAADLCHRILADDDLPIGRLADVAALLSDLYVHIGRYSEACVQAERALELANHGHQDHALLAASSFGYATACLGEPEVGRRRLEEAFEQANLTDRPELIEAAGRHYVELLMGPLNQMGEGVEVARATASQLLDRGVEPRMVTSLLAAATKGLFRLGRWTEANDYATAALDSDPTGSGVTELLLARARVVMGLGDFRTTDNDLDAVANLMGPEPNPSQFLAYATLRAGSAWWASDVRTARTHIDHALDIIEQTDFDDHWVLAPFVWHGIRAEAQASRLNLPSDEQRLNRLDNTCQWLHGGLYQPGSDESKLLEAYRLLCEAERSWITANPDTDLWEQAATAWADCGHPYPAAYANLQLAEVMFSQRTRNRVAGAALVSAHQTVRELSATPLREAIEELALRARVNLIDADTDTGGASATAAEPETRLSVLTDREREVLACAARGLSNRQIGEELYISARTAGVHISNILSKLGVRSRVEAAAVFITISPDTPGDNRDGNR